MLDLKYEFSPVYWRHNFTLVPTTTTTTTTTTSTTSTTTPSTTTGKVIQPAFPPPIAYDDMGNDVAADESRETSVTEDKVLVSGISGSTKDKSVSGSERIQQHGSVIGLAMVSLFWFVHRAL